MREASIDIWKKKVDWIASKGGMVMVDTHPDYMAFGSKKPKFDEFPVAFYREFLEYINVKYERAYWHVLPKDVAAHWKTNYED